MRLPKDILNAGLYTKPNFFLCQTDKEKICKLETIETKGSFKFNSLSEISFETARVYNDIITGETKINPYYDLIEALRLIYVDGFGYFELQGPELIADGIEEKKSCIAYSLEYTLSQKYLENFYINIGTVESKEVLNSTPGKSITPITLYNPTKPEFSLLHLVLEEIYGWKIGHVDSALWTLSRQFEIDRESVYDFLMNDVCEKFNCYIVFDTINNTINVYAESLTAKFIGDGKTNTFTIFPPFVQIGTVSIDGYKTTQWSYNASTGTLVLDDTPESGSHIEIVDGALTEWETDVLVSFNNLAQEASINYDADSIKTKLTVIYGDDLDIREVNLGLPYLTDISYYYTKGWMGEDLYDAYTKYMQKSNNSQSQYTTNSQEILKWNNYIAYEENRLSLEYSEVSVDASTVGTYYTRQENLDGSHYYSEVSLPSEYVVDVQYYSNLTTNLNEDKVSDLYTALKSYYNAKHTHNDINDAIDQLEKLQDSFSFMETHTITTLSNALKSNISDSKKESEIYAFLHEMWIEVGRTPLKTLYLEPYKKVQETNIKDGWSDPKNENYGLYYPVTLFITSIETTIVERDDIIKGYENERQVFVNANADISNSLLMRNNFTEGQLIRLSAFLREDELRLDDIVETSIDDASSSFKIKQDAMESGKIELQKLCQPQLQFSMTMANIYALSEFEPIIGQFQLGNVIRVALRPDYVKQSRLLQVDINFDDFSDFSCEFGELTSLRTQSDIHADLLSNAISAGKSVATNSSYWTRGSNTATAIDLKIQQGLLDATTQIKAIDGNQGVVIDKYGIKLQKKMDNGEIDPKQTWLVNNMILMSDDGFKTSRSALGEITVDGQAYYGLIAEMVLSGYIEGSIIKGGTIQIGEYTDKDGKKRYIFEVDKDGNVSMCGGTVQFSSNKNSLIDLEESIPTKTSQLDNDSGYQNETGVVSIIDGTVNADYVNALEINVDAANIKGKLTADQIDVDNLSVKAANITGELTIGQLPSDIAAKADIPTNVSELTNDSGYKNETGVVSIINGTVNADYVNALELKVKAGNITDTLTIGQLPSDVATQGDIPTTEQITTITKDTVTTEYVNALNITAKDFSAETIIGKNISGGSLLIGNQSGTYAQITTEGKLSCHGADVQGKITATEGEIGGCIITDGKLQIDAARITSGTIDNARISDLSADKITSGTINANNVKISNLTVDGAQITSGTIDSARIGELSADKITSGTINANNVTISGTLSSAEISASKITSGDIGNNGSTSGVTIAGWKIGNGYLYADYYGFVGLYSDSPSITILGQTKDDWRIVAGGSDNRNFGVDKNGNLYAAAGYIAGFALQSNGSLSSDRTDSLSETSDGDTRIKLRGAYTGVGMVKSSLSPLALRIEDDNSKGISLYRNMLSYNGTSTSFPSSDKPGFGFKSDGGKLFGTWYTSSSSVVTSDKNMKNTIELQSEVYSRVFDKLKPSTFKYNDGCSDRIHLGLIAQDVEDAVLTEDLTTKDFAPVCYDIDENGNKFNYGIRYEELVSMCIYEIQKLKRRISELELQ